MSKARNLADLLSDGAELADGQISVAEVVGAAPLASPTFTGTASGTFSGPLTGNVTGNLTGNVTGAVTGDVTAPEIDLTAISSTIADTAVDVFVYDTSKDSDGGAWRKRTQHTSWYNETLNTATRGSRKEFPAVAVIVAETNQVTIYDGDDPDLPMWMVFNSAANQNILVNSTFYNLAAVNGVLCVGTLGITINFISEFVRGHRDATSALYFNGPYNGSIAERNGNKGWTRTADQLLVNATVNDVAMTVLPNAPIDYATGLPVPTIAVATEGGVSVIKDDGAVVDHTNGAGYDTAYQVDFLDDYRYVGKFNESTSASNAGVFVVENFTSSSPTFNLYNSRNTYNNSYGPSVTTNVGSTGGVPKNLPAIYTGKKEFAVAGDRFLAQVSEGNTLPSGMVAYTASSYATGYLNGDIKLATLSDTDDTDVVGSELVTNGDFATDSDWNKGTNWTISGGVANHTSTAGYLEQTLNMSVGQRVTITMTITGNVVILGNGTSIASSNIILPVGTSSVTGTVVSSTLSLYMSGSGTVDNVSVRLAEQDRSVNGNGLQVFGTVTKNPVATGADLVAYSGFSSSNYLEQPYNSDLDFGTGDFCIIGWNKGTDTTGYLIVRNDGSGSTDRIAVDVSSSKYRFYLEAGATGILTSTSDANTNTWTQFCALRRSGTTELYINGKLEASGTSTLDLDNSSCILHIGDVPHIGNNYYGSLALFRISATAPSPEQIKKIYEDEKVLFQENAQATLYGSSDAVTALAYDDSTELLHVGTSEGRSDFQGLRRVNNTTNAVGAAISASNGMIVEE